MLASQLISGFATLIFVSNVATATTAIAIPKDIPSKIEYYAESYNVSPKILTNIINCESSMDPKAINSSKKEFSVGLSQINLMAHKDITVNQAMDPDYAIDFLAKHLSKGNGKMWSCFAKLYGV